MAISFQSDEEVLRNLREKLRRMTDEELIRFGKEVRKLAENPFQRQLEEARREEAEKEKRCFDMTMSIISFRRFGAEPVNARTEQVLWSFRYFPCSKYDGSCAEQPNRYLGYMAT